MAIVNTRSANNPRFTDNSYKYHYSFVQPPAQWSPQVPSGVFINGEPMPVRDINDAANGTDTWRHLRGEDLYFAYEAAMERYAAFMQFDMLGDWPRSTYFLTRNKGCVESGLWRYAQGNVPNTTSKTGMAACYDNCWLSGVSSASDLRDVYSSWADGTPITHQKPQGAHDTYRGADWSWYLDFAAGKWELSDMVSKYDDFQPGDPLVGDNVRKVYYDLQRLRHYTPEAGYGQAWNVANFRTTAWAKSGWSYTEGFTPDAPMTGTSKIWEEQRSCWDIGTSSQRGGWWGFYTNGGEYYFPRPGKLNADGNYTTYLGTPVACYLALQADANGDDISQRVVYEFRKVPFSLTTDGKWVQVQANHVANAAYQMVNQNNMGVPREWGSAYRYVGVNIDNIRIVCEVSDRTDVSKLGWNWTPPQP